LRGDLLGIGAVTMGDSFTIATPRIQNALQRIVGYVKALEVTMTR